MPVLSQCASNGGKIRLDMSMSRRLIIAGVNNGIGLAVTRALLEQLL